MNTESPKTKDFFQTWHMGLLDITLDIHRHLGHTHRRDTLRLLVPTLHRVILLKDTLHRVILVILLHHIRGMVGMAGMAAWVQCWLVVQQLLLLHMGPTRCRRKDTVPMDTHRGFHRTEFPLWGTVPMVMESSRIMAASTMASLSMASLAMVGNTDTESSRSGSDWNFSHQTVNLYYEYSIYL